MNKEKKLNGKFFVAISHNLSDLDFSMIVLELEMNKS